MSTLQYLAGVALPGHCGNAHSQRTSGIDCMWRGASHGSRMTALTLILWLTDGRTRYRACCRGGRLFVGNLLKTSRASGGRTRGAAYP